MSTLQLKRKYTKLFLIVTLTALIIMPAFFSKPAVAQTSQYYDKFFAWDYDGRHWTWNLSIPVALYEAYKEIPVSARTENGPAGYGFLTTTQDQYVRMLASNLNKTATEQGYSSYEKVSFVLGFVQSLPYTSDNVTEGYNEYPRFPIETLVDDGGDCEDTSILFATLTILMGYGTVYINPPNHYAVGVLGHNLHGVSWTYPQGSNDTYYYCETTGDNFEIGQLPVEFTGQDAYIYTIDETIQFKPDIQVRSIAEPTATDSPFGKPDPTVAGPTVQQAHPLSFNLISENPLLFVVIVFAIAVSIGVTIWSVRRPKGASSSSMESDVSQSSSNVEDKYCIFCGSSNKSFAAYCEKCGKQISQT